MNWVTVAIVVVCGLLTWRAYRAGFIRELVGFCALILAIPVAGVFYDDMYPNVQPIVDNDNLANLISFLAIVTGVVIGGQVVAYLLREAASVLNLGAADHIAGAAFGLLQGIVVCQVVLVGLVAFPKPDVRADIDGSPLATALLDGTPLIIAILPGYFDEVVGRFLDGVEIASGALDGEATPTPTAEP
jgi:uncharacterized membrane protein required for colicin V production